MGNVGLYIVWDKKYESSIPIIDEQHRAIVSLINSLYYFMQEDRAIDALMPTINMLSVYAILHFNTEEPLMKRAGYKDFDQHCALHQQLINKTAVVMQRTNEEKDATILLKFLKNWWLTHINVEDRKYMALVRHNEGI
jgi:hemerythrin